MSDSGTKITLGRPGSVRLQTDPVCGMKVDPATARGGSHEHAGKTYWFCNPRCRERFAADPEHWLKAGPSIAAMAAPGPAPAPAAAPPDSRRVRLPDGPGGPRDEAGPLPDLRHGARAAHGDPRRGEEPRARGHDAAVPGLPGPHRAPPRAGDGGDAARATSSTASCRRPPRGGSSSSSRRRSSSGAGWPFFERMWTSFRTGRLNMFTLIGIGTGVAWLYSVAAVLVPGLFPASFRAHDGEVGRYFESAAVIVTLVLMGQVLELRARQRTSGAIKALLGLAPKTARRLAADGSEADVPLDDVRPGDRLRVRPGEKVPVDGVVLEGTTQRRRVDDHGRAGAGREGAGIAA